MRMSQDASTQWRSSTLTPRLAQAARHFLRRGVAWNPEYRALTPIKQLTLFDIALSGDPLPDEITSDPRVRVKTGDLTIEGIAKELIDRPDTSVVHLA